ncbi:MAG: peptidylprolyl isomerase [Pirellulales bacterium]
MILTVSLATYVAAQAPLPPPGGPAVPATPAKPGTPQEAAFEEVYAKWNEILKQLGALQTEFQTTPNAQKAAVAQRFEAIRANAEKTAPELRRAAEAAFLANPKNERIGELLMMFVIDDVDEDQYAEAIRVSKILQSQNFADPRLAMVLGNLAWCTNDFPASLRRYQAAEKSITHPEAQKEIQAGIKRAEHYNKMWAAETAIRNAEAQANDLPRVKLSTTKGDIVIELYENEAPIAVANFINLVEKKFYDGTYFHRVLPGFMAQGGDPNTKNADRRDDGQGGPGYTIKCECDKPNARMHFRGTLSMAHAGKDTGGSQFFLTFRPTEHLDGRHTAFGRVIEGLDVLDKLQRINPEFPGSVNIKPDTITTATVIRKRDHEYVPQTLPKR